MMLKLKKTYTLLLLVAGFSSYIFGQSTIDTVEQIIFVNTSDSTYITNDSLLTDSLTIQDSNLNDSIKINAKTEKDTTNYSLYGYVFQVNDTLTTEKWHFNPDIHYIDINTYDSTLNDFHFIDPFIKNSTSNTQLGGNGLPGISNIYFNRTPPTGYLFMKSFTPYTYQSKSIEYHNVKRPFTVFRASIGPKDEQNIGVIHTQNVTPYFNFFVKYNSYSTKGEYLHQKARNNSGVVGASYTKGRLSSHANFIFSKINAQESGGIVDNRLFTDTTLNERELGSKLKDGLTIIKDKQWFFDQKFGFIKTKMLDTLGIGGYLMSIQYNYQSQKAFKNYSHSSDTYINTITGDTLSFYQNNYSGLATSDSNFYKKKTHLFRFNLEEIPEKLLSVGLYGGYGFDKIKHSYINKDTLFINKMDKTLSNYFIEAGIYKLIPKGLKFSASYRSYTNGYRAGDFAIKGNITQSYKLADSRLKIEAWGELSQTTPDYYYNHYQSNNFRWNNSFNKVKLTKFESKVSYPKFKTTIGIRYELLNNYVYFNKLALPEQYTSNISVLDINCNNHLKVWHMNLITRINYQKTSDEDILPLPELSYYGALYFGKYIQFPATQGIMQLNIGADVFYWSKFYAPGYTPATSTFHNQKDQLIGDYPFLGLFANIEIKRLRIFAKIDNVSNIFFKNLDKNYFTAPNYPTSKGTFRYGIAWTFYD